MTDEQQSHLVKAEMALHPLFEQLVSSHVSSLHVATPIDHLLIINAQLAQSHHLLRSYAAQHRQSCFSCGGAPKVLIFGLKEFLLCELWVMENKILNAIPFR
ncbi:hypothetical protein J5N97_005271 [Dioscorea zingiberensis]|uniref:KNOX1 domain-containing protein n=1 Tax=Dioscorea zingiberensis TaxID=325984 RepID=A0A9D5D7R3_9LILI|nr:hypothetical protein J5N97_005271 [Dioscorea zingiberensis]